MASSCIVLSEDQFLCSICMDVFTDPVATPCGHSYCKTCITDYWDNCDVCKCPICQNTFDERPNVFVNILLREMVHQLRCHKLKEEYERKTEAEVQQLIQEREGKIQEVKHSVELSRNDGYREMEDGVKVFAALTNCIQRSQAEFIDVMEEKQKTTEKQADGFIYELEQEIAELRKRISELKQLSHTEDHLLQNSYCKTCVYTATNSLWRPTKDWTKVNVHRPLGHNLTMKTMKIVAQLEKTHSQEMQKLYDAELRRIQLFAVDVTLDPDTAHPKLILSEDRKQVVRVKHRNNLPDNKERFSHEKYVLGKQAISSGRFYYEVQVKKDAAWTIGMARESMNRKEHIILSPSNGCWTIQRCDEWYDYEANADPDVRLTVGEDVQKVGVFVDYEGGLVSFYDVKARVHLYSFTGCTFTEKLYPLLWTYFGAALQLTMPTL